MPAISAKFSLVDGAPRLARADGAAVVGDDDHQRLVPEPGSLHLVDRVAEQAVGEAHHQHVALLGLVEQELVRAPGLVVEAGDAGPATGYWLPSGRKRHGTCGMT